MTTLPLVRRATYREGDAIAALIAQAFQHLDPVAWLVPDPEQRHSVLTANFRILVEHAFFYGEVHVLDDRSAAAVWFDRSALIPPPAEYDRRLAAACGPYTERFTTLDKLFDAHHPTEPHHHLAFLAVTPDKQCTGRGTALLRHHHARLDRIGMPAYLEASSTGSRDLYARQGYIERERFLLPNYSAFYSMWRPARLTGTEPAS
ncbi:GNAT family N-acetyltransferase [Plantactinospora sp. CA-294935]|uniref:GNAT family N-acetyltransferase n=1 Tax=Plantactinospora sp. CA-294935 TaxID=3240012 RepID=UPI003D90419E